ncbi:DUF1963 domain-containing protein [Actinoplanes bogorensis]|uniref:DUF1963 domain-containing protein n=1 Tax=Paractinoplanes bogorensis TaxID=1610840 RepID=A0ABS5YJQ2_9ACTN|nr:YwqG family protein [Actinoplanes bogorensis]MBU2663703.1 DUF1963 domain-containing protein [Actinoplanes bogorensis]
MGISESMSNAAALIAVARATLPPAVVDVWIGLLRPAVRLRLARPGEQVVGQLGGSPSLPDSMPWPQSPAGLPLGFVAGIDLSRLPVTSLDIPLPAHGTLLFFYREPSSSAAAVVSVPTGTATSERAEPEAPAYPAVDLAAELVATEPGWDHPALKRAVAELSAADQEFMADLYRCDDFRIEMAEQLDQPRHYVGGYARPVQGSVEVDVAQRRLGGRSEPALHDEARRWTSLMQIDSDDDADMMWGDCGSLYWVMRPADIAAQRFEAAAFVTQCS